MNEYVITALVVLATLGAGLFLLLTFGITFVSYIAVGVIVSVLLASLLYTWWKSRTDKTVVLLKIEILSKMRDALEKLESGIKEASEFIDVEPFMRDLRRIKRELISRGFFTKGFEVNERRTEKVTLTAIELESRKVEQQLRSLESLAAASYGEAASKRMEELLGAARTLAESGFPVSGEYEELRRIVSLPSASLAELLEKHRRGEEGYLKIVDKCIGEAEFLLDTAEGIADVSHLRRELETVKNLKYSVEVVPKLQKVRSEAASYLTKPFLQARKEIVSYLERVLSFSKKDFVKEERALRILREKALGYSDPGCLGELSALREEAKRLTLELARILAREVVALEEELKKQGVVKVRRRGVESYVSKLDPRKDFSLFSREAIGVLRVLSGEFDTRYKTVKIAKNYPAIEKIIDQKLREKGEVYAEELRVRYAGDFLKRYSEAHPEVKFEKNALKLKG
ncbi:hypothetical protein [Candidatus Pyrohabitans sp.]